MNLYNEQSINVENRIWCSKSAASIFLSIITFIMLFFPYRESNAFPIPLGDITYTSEDSSMSLLTGPLDLSYKKQNLRTGDVTEFMLNLEEGATVSYADRKTKNGGLRLVGTAGDPLAFLEGPILTGAAEFDFATSGVPELFPTSTVSATLRSGSIRAGITLPGDQLTGPDGNDTYIQYDSFWSSSDPIGTFNDGFDDFNIILGDFSLNSVGRPSSFFYNLNSDGTGNAQFTVAEALDTGFGQAMPGIVTKRLEFVNEVTEPNTIFMFGIASIALFGFSRFRPKCRRRSAWPYLGHR